MFPHDWIQVMCSCPEHWIVDGMFQVSCLEAEHQPSPNGWSCMIFPLYNKYIFICLQHYTPLGDTLRACTDSVPHWVFLDSSTHSQIFPDTLFITIIAKCWLFNLIFLLHFWGSTWHSAASKSLLFPPIYLLSIYYF